MHRTKTQFAKRINRVASGLERRGVVATYEVQDRLLANRSSRRRYAQVAPALDDVQRVVLERLREVNAARFVDETEAGLASEREGGESALRRRAGKEFLVRKYSWGVTLGLDDPWLRLGVNPRLLDLANGYLEMWSKLEYVDVWYTPPAGADERRSSQRWHRDFNDRHLLKAFIYLVDVDNETGPFEYVPRSAPGGELDRLWPWRPLGDNYPPEDEFAQKVDGRSVSFTAPKGTIIFCNTSGFHRGGFATGKPRVLATLTWDSPASLKALSERNYVFAASDDEPASEVQRYALT